MTPDEEAEAVADIEAAVGSPATRWNELKDKVQQENVKKFDDVAVPFLDLLWSLDQHRIKGIPPRGLADQSKDADSRMSGAYRLKGSWFADLVALLLVNRTNSPLAPRTNVQGFSQRHQIDIAWPARAGQSGRRLPIEAPRVCVETKVMGGPPYGSVGARASTADWTNRRKELKFQATDLKLFRRQNETQIDHWDNWRKAAPPKVFFLWCARMKPRTDNLDRMIKELRALNETYLDGAALFAYEESKDKSRYEMITIPWADRVVSLDDTLHRIANEINDLVGPDGELPTALLPDHLTVDIDSLEADGE